MAHWYEWVFSGMGVALLVWIFRFIHGRRKGGLSAPSPISTEAEKKKVEVKKQCAIFHEIVRLSEGEYRDIELEKPVGVLCNFRVTLKAIEMMSKPTGLRVVPTEEVLAARISCDSSSWLTNLGRYVKEVSSSEYILPLCKAYELEYSLSSFGVNKSNGYYFSRIVVTHINSIKREVELDFFAASTIGI